MLKKAVIVYCSPGGSTRHVAQVIEKELEHNNITVLSADLGNGDDCSSVISEVGNEKIYLFIGSPVYNNRPVPPVLRFISDLPEKMDVCAVPFVTWGGASSGIALYDMGEALISKGLPPVGAGKVLALHSLMWQFENPLGEGHPDEEDDHLIRELVKKVLKKAEIGSPKSVPLSDLAYQPEKIHAQMEKIAFETAVKYMPKKEINENLCTECGLCAEICPVQAIILSPYPEFGENCITCFQCVKECPEDAVIVDLTPGEELLRAKAKQFDERPFTQIFV